MLPFIQDPKLTDTELAQAAVHLSQPVVKKYLTRLAADIAEDVLRHTEPAEGQSAESFLRSRTSETGRLEVLTTLLAIEAANPGQPQ